MSKIPKQFAKILKQNYYSIFLSYMLKLTDILNPQQNKHKLYELRNLKNSFQRNLMSPSQSILEKSTYTQYQSMLSNHHFQGKDIFLLFSHLYRKEEMSASDRNLIRKILLMIFEEDVILSAGKDLVRYAKYQTYQKDDTICMMNNFYFLLKGYVILKLKHYTKQYRGGQYFGHIELLARKTNNYPELYFSSDSHLLTINAQDFYKHLFHYFQYKLKQKQQIFPEIITVSMPKIKLYLLLEEMTETKFNVGDKIVKKNQEVQFFYILRQGKVSEQSEKIVNVRRKLGMNGKCVGFSQYFGETFRFQDNVFALEKVRAYSLAVSIFEKYVPLSLIHEIKSELVQAINLSKLRKEKQTPEIPKSKNFMRIRRVKLSLPKKLQTSSNQTRDNSLMDEQSRFRYMADFMFVKNTGSFRNARVHKSFLQQKSICNSDSNFTSLPHQF